MNAPTENVTIVRDANGQPAFVVIPFADYQSMKLGMPHSDGYIPSEVIDIVLENRVSAARGWREYLGLTQNDVVARMGITQSAYAQLEGRKTLRKSTREKLAKALNILEEQLDF